MAIRIARRVHRIHLARAAQGLALGLVLAAAGSVADPSGIRAAGFDACRVTAEAQASSCRFEAREDRLNDRAVCLNLIDREERDECRDEVDEAYKEAQDLCGAQRSTRRWLCRAPELAGRYDPEIDPEDFVAGIDNPYAPFQVGSRWVYEKETDEGLEQIEIEVLEETREILGVECTTVRDTVRLDGVLVEDTLDYVAQDEDGNVWYFGELVKNFEDGILADLDGSFIAGEDGAKPGFWVKAAPTEGELYRQEWFLGEAEDIVEVVSTDADEEVPFANGEPVLQTRDFTPIEPDVFEFKFYVPGVGAVLEIDPETGERLELVEFQP